MEILKLQQKVFSMLYSKGAFDHAVFDNVASLSIEDGFSIYKQSRQNALLETLRQTYEVCLKLTGDQFFDAMAAIYIQNTPSLSPNINDYGESFSEFIQNFKHAESLPYLADTARFEWCWHKALHAENTFPFDPQELTQIPENDHPKIVFELPKSASLFSSSYPIDKIWAFNQKNYQGSDTLDIEVGATKLMIWRDGMDTRIDSISSDSWDFLYALDQGLPMGELDEVLEDEQSKHLSEMLVELLKKGYITGYHLNE